LDESSDKDSPNKKLEMEKLNLKTDFDKCIEGFCSQYDKYLTENMPKPSIFPVTLKLRVLHKRIDIDGFVMKPNDRSVGF
jgi:hypothetical protein